MFVKSPLETLKDFHTIDLEATYGSLLKRQLFFFQCFEVIWKDSTFCMKKKQFLTLVGEGDNLAFRNNITSLIRSNYHVFNSLN